MSETGAVTLTEFLTARLDEDEKAARDWYGSGTVPGRSDTFWLDEIAAKRHIIELRYSWNLEAERMPEPPFGPILKTQVNTADAILRRLAAVYSDHPDYREDW